MNNRIVIHNTFTGKLKYLKLHPVNWIFNIPRVKKKTKGIKVRNREQTHKTCIVVYENDDISPVIERGLTEDHIYYVYNDGITRPPLIYDTTSIKVSCMGCGKPLNFDTSLNGKKIPTKLKIKTTLCKCGLTYFITYRPVIDDKWSDTPQYTSVINTVMLANVTEAVRLRLALNPAEKETV